MPKLKVFPRPPFERQLASCTEATIAWRIWPARSSRPQFQTLCESCPAGADADEYFATETATLNSLEAPSFEAIAIDEKGEPLRIVATDPRVWVAHRLWLSKRKDRKAFERRRDREMAHAIGRLVAEYMPHLQFASDQLQMLPKSLSKEAALVFGR